MPGRREQCREVRSKARSEGIDGGGRVGAKDLPKVGATRRSRHGRVCSVFSEKREKLLCDGKKGLSAGAAKMRMSSDSRALDAVLLWSSKAVSRETVSLWVLRIDGDNPRPFLGAITRITSKELPRNMWGARWRARWCAMRGLGGLDLGGWRRLQSNRISNRHRPWLGLRWRNKLQT